MLSYSGSRALARTDLVIAIGDEDASSSDDSESEETVQDSAEGDAPRPPRKLVRAFHGAAEWGAKQLEREVRRGSWRVVPRQSLTGGALARLVFAGSTTAKTIRVCV